jgi:hypothetical protein
MPLPLDDPPSGGLTDGPIGPLCSKPIASKAAAVVEDGSSTCSAAPA